MINLHDYLTVGQNAVVQKVVRPEDASDKYISAFKELLSAPRLIHWSIDAATDAIDPYLPEEYASIGTAIQFECTAPTSVGMTITARVTIKEIGERDVLLSIEAWDEQGTIGHGTHRRMVVETENVLNRMRERVKTISSRRILNWAKK
ncbi:MAG: hypothetical protein IJP51_04655 [Acidaminococcaceae bacterium]|nr:hypothetical protein [Acidaminococcaceae bacterium]MBQ6778765.1 hypothetical protein [Acidaminococcaceae bacterium]